MHGNETIEHKGKVVQVHPESVEVAIEARTACAGCHAKAICGSDNGQEKLILVATPEVPYYTTGEEVVVSIGRALGFKAVFIAYIIPFIIVMTALLIMLQTGVAELTAGVISLGMLVVYYVAIYLLRAKIAKEIVFKIKKTVS